MITKTTNFWGDVVNELASLVVTGNEMVEGGYIFISEGIRKSRALPRVTMDNIIQERKATPTPQGNFTYTEKVLTPSDFMVYIEFNPNDFRDIWDEFATDGQFLFSELDATVQAKLLDLVMNGANGVNAYMGKMILNGNEAGAVAPYTFFNGIVTRALADPDVIDVSNYAALTSSNIATKLGDLYNATRIPVRRNKKARIFMSSVDVEKYKDYQLAQPNKGIDVTMAPVLKFRGVPIVELVDLPENCMFLTIASSDQGSNIWMGTNVVADFSSIQVEKLQPNSELWFFKMIMAADTQIKFGQDFTLYHA